MVRRAIWLQGPCLQRPKARGHPSEDARTLLARAWHSIQEYDVEPTQEDVPRASVITSQHARTLHTRAGSDAKYVTPCNSYGR